MGYMTVKEAAQKWGISERQAQQLCVAGRIKGAAKFGGAWAIPSDAAKPADPRRSSDAEPEACDMSPESATESELFEFTFDSGTATTSDRYAAAFATILNDRSDDRMPHTVPQHVVMPLLNTPFLPGKCMETAESIPDPDQRNIALGEAYYFSGQAERASDIVEPYLTHEDIALRLSACWIYAYANFAMDRINRSREVMGHVKTTLDSVDEQTPESLRALAVFVTTGSYVLLHLPIPESVPPLMPMIRLLPPGIRLFALYIQAHDAYLRGAYAASAGIVETALALEVDVYPIPTIYLHMVAVMNYMSLRHVKEAEAHLLAAWELARPDDLIEAFGEHHGLLGGMLEATIKRDYPEDFRRIISITYKFSAGWRKIHNPDTGHHVADNLTTTEFAAAMLAARDWSNKEIAAHMGISEHTVKTYITGALQKLHITKRKDLKNHMLQ